MDKEKFIEILESIDIPVNEGIQNDKDKNKYPRIVFWDYVWEPYTASGIRSEEHTSELQSR